MVGNRGSVPSTIDTENDDWHRTQWESIIVDSGNRSDIKRFRWADPHRVILALGTHQALEPMQRRKCEQLASGTNCLLEVAECIGLQHPRSASQEEPQGEMALNYIEDSFCTNKRRKDPQTIHRPQFSPAYLIFLYFTSGLGLLERKTLMIHLNP